MITNAQLKFDYRFVNWSSYPANATPLGAGDNLQIQVSTDAGASYTTVYTLIKATMLPALALPM
jgi:hypothetical protein